MKKKILFVGAFLISFIVANSVLAEMVSFGPFVLDRSNIYAIVSEKGAKFDVELGVYGMLFGKEIKLESICEDKYDWEKAIKTTNSITDYINKNNSLDLLKMLSDVGLSGCKVVPK